MVVAFEHRHYGKSVPFGSLSQESLKYLSSQQALADYAVLREQIRKQYNIGSANKWVAVGGSYSGNLAAWIRNKYPHLFDMALGTSAPVKATVNFPEYMRVVQASLGDSCANVVRSMFYYLHTNTSRSNR
jgi:pimeloyl-ACP methyl ester carboxylesterase